MDVGQIELVFELSRIDGTGHAFDNFKLVDKTCVVLRAFRDFPLIVVINTPNRRNKRLISVICTATGFTSWLHVGMTSSCNKLNAVV
jgi:hypothetical protein